MIVHKKKSDRNIMGEKSTWQLPEAATSAISFFVTCAMKPTMEKITKPANMLVQELIKHTMTESLGRGNRK